MRYDIRQVVTYHYESVIPSSRHSIHMIPVSRNHQRVIWSDLRIEPAPRDRAEAFDFYGNSFIQAVIETAHTELVVETTARVEVEPREAITTGGPPWESILPLTLAHRSLTPEEPVHYIFPTPLVPILSEVTDYAAESFTPGRPVVEAVFELTQRIKADFQYDPTATDVATPVAESFKARAGVCQDFAQIMLAGLRGLGLPAAYISGYLRTEPPPGQPRLEGADATHAWAAVWCGSELGWLGFDPTNGITAGEDHIILALGRDYQEVAPLGGVVIGYGGHTIDVGVDVIPLDQPPAPVSETDFENDDAGVLSSESMPTDSKPERLEESIDEGEVDPTNPDTDDVISDPADRPSE